MNKSKKTKINMRKELITIDGVLKNFNNRLSFIESSLSSLNELLIEKSIIKDREVDIRREENTKNHVLKNNMIRLKKEIETGKTTINDMFYLIIHNLKSMAMDISDINLKIVDLGGELSLVEDYRSKLETLYQSCKNSAILLNDEVCANRENCKVFVYGEKCEECDLLQAKLNETREVLNISDFSFNNLEVLNLIKIFQ